MTTYFTYFKNPNEDKMKFTLRDEFAPLFVDLKVSEQYSIETQFLARCTPPKHEAYFLP